MRSSIAASKSAKRAGAAERSRKALADWAGEAGWHVAFAAPGRGKRRGIVDAVLVRTAPGDADAVQVRLVHLRAGKGALPPAAEKRLERAAERVEIEVLHVSHDGKGLCFSAPILPAWHPQRRVRRSA